MPINRKVGKKEGRKFGKSIEKVGSTGIKSGEGRALPLKTLINCLK